MTALSQHRKKQSLGGAVYLLTIDMSVVTRNPAHVRRFVNSYGDDGTGEVYQGNTYKPWPYQVKSVKKNSKANRTGAKVSISDIESKELTRFIDQVGGSLQGARVIELKVYGTFLDNGDDPNPLAYAKRLDHIVNYTEDDGSNKGELIIHTIDPLSRKVDVPSLSFSAGEPNSTKSVINVFPAVDRRINSRR